MSGEFSVQSVALTRRAFVARAGTLAVGIAFAGGDAEAAAGAAGFNPNAWVNIAASGVVTICSAPAEMGQGIMTGLPLCLAEELDADWSRVRVEQSPGIPRIFGNPAIGMEMSTHGDYSLKGYFQSMRLIGAQTRQVLLLNAARIWNVPPAELRTEPGVVLHDRSHRRLGYGSIARRALLPASLPVVALADLKPRSAWRLLGSSVPRVDIPAKTSGRAVYGIDVQQPGMLYGAMLYPPVPRERPLDIDDAAARKIPGIVSIVGFDRCVGIIGETVEATRAAKELLRVSWSRATAAARYDTRAAASDYLRIANDLEQQGFTTGSRGDAPAALAGAVRALTREYHCEHVAHTAIEPIGGTALVEGDHVTLWLATQAPTMVLDWAARAAGTSQDKVTVHSTFIGGGFGRLSDEGDNAYEATLLAKQVPGRAVKLIRSREDDFLTGKFRPLAAQRIDVGLDAAGDIVGWRHRVVSASAYARFKPRVYQATGGMDYVCGLGCDVLYGWPNHLSQFVRADCGYDVGPWRGIAFGYTTFAIETLIDELAALRAMDPLEYRLRLLASNPGAVQVLRKVAEMADWQRPMSGCWVWRWRRCRTASPR
jgi:isoquinoline 1-oxidoreductase beta subunit